MPIHCEINGVDYSDVIYDLDLEPAGRGTVGTGTLRLLEPGSSITDRQTVKIWRVDGSGHLVRRYFGGYVGGAGTGRLSISTTKTWEIPLQSYDLAGKRLASDVVPGGEAVSLAADTFANQVLDAVTQWQEFGGTPSVYIDATSQVVNLTGATVLPAITGLAGLRLDAVLQRIADNARAVDTALRPRWRFGLDTTFGAGAVFGPPVLYMYNAADATSTTASFGDLLNNIIVGTYKRTTSSPALVNRRQSVYLDGLAVVTSEETTSHATYPFDLAGDGYWGDAPLQDRDSGTEAAAQAALDRDVAATAYPRETVEFDTFTWVEPGDTVDVTWSADGLSAVGYRVAGVRLQFRKGDDTLVDTPRLTLTLGSVPREIGVDDQDEVGGIPVVGDHSAPDAPTALVGTSAYDGSTGRTVISGTFHSPPQADYNYSEIRYRQRKNGGAWGDWAVVTGLRGAPDTDQAYTVPGLHYSISGGDTWETYLVAQAFDFNRNGSGLSDPPTVVTNAAQDAPGPPTSLTYTTRYLGNGSSEIVVSFTAGTGGGTRAYYVFTVTPNAGPTREYRVDGAATSLGIKDAVPGVRYDWQGQAYTAYGDGGALSSSLATIAASALLPGQQRDPAPDDLDSNAGTFSRAFTPSKTGSGTVPTRSTAVVWEGQSTWSLAVGATAGTASVTTAYQKAAAPGTVLSFRFREGNAGAAQGTLALYIQPYDKSGAAVGSAVAAYSSTPSTSASGTLREGQYTLPSTSTITAYGWELRYTGNAANARTVQVTGAQVTPVAQRSDVADLAIGPAQAALGHDVLLNGSMEVPNLTGTLPAGWTSSGTVAYSTSLDIGAGDGQYACKLGVATGTHTLTSPLVLWTQGRGYSGRIRWLEYQSTTGAGLTVTVTARWYDASRTYLSSTTLTRETTPSAGAWQGNTAVWDGTSIPANTAYVAVQFQAVTTSATPYYGADALEIAAISRIGILNNLDHRTGAGLAVGSTIINGTGSLDYNLYDSSAWMRILTGAGWDLGSRQYKGGSVDVTGELKGDHALLNSRKITAGASLPGSPSSGDTHWYSTYGVWCYYDGTRWLGPEVPIPVHNYLGSPPFSSNLEILATGIRSDRALLVTRFTASYYTGGGVDGSNYWRIYLRRLTSGVSVDNLGYIQTTNNNWYKESDLTSFSNNPLNATDLWLQVYLEMTGSPNSIYVQAAIYGRWIYT